MISREQAVLGVADAIGATVGLPGVGQLLGRLGVLGGAPKLRAELLEFMRAGLSPAQAAELLRPLGPLTGDRVKALRRHLGLRRTDLPVPFPWSCLYENVWLASLSRHLDTSLAGEVPTPCWQGQAWYLDRIAPGLHQYLGLRIRQLAGGLPWI